MDHNKVAGEFILFVVRIDIHIDIVIDIDIVTRAGSIPSIITMNTMHG